MKYRKKIMLGTIAGIAAAVALAVSFFITKENSTAVALSDKFNVYVQNGNYSYAAALYDSNVSNKYFLKRVNGIIDIQKNTIIENINVSNVEKAKEFCGFLEKINKNEIRDQILQVVGGVEEERNQKAEKAMAEKKAEEEAQKAESTAYEKADFIHYHNSRYGFSIDYPDFLTEKRVSTSGNAVEFSNSQGTVKLTATGKNNSFKVTAEGLYNNVISEKKNIISKSLDEKSFVVSWEEEDKIYYSDYEVGKGSIDSFQICYPKENKDEFSSIIEKIKAGFSTSGLDASW